MALNEISAHIKLMKVAGSADRTVRRHKDKCLPVEKNRSAEENGNLHGKRCTMFQKVGKKTGKGPIREQRQPLTRATGCNG